MGGNTVILREIRFLLYNNTGNITPRVVPNRIFAGTSVNPIITIFIANDESWKGGRVSLLKDGDIKSGWEVLRDIQSEQIMINLNIISHYIIPIIHPTRYEQHLLKLIKFK